MNSTEKKLKEFVENDEFYKDNLYVENPDDMEFSIDDVKLEIASESITFNNICLFTTVNYPKEYYLLLPEVVYRLKNCDYDFRFDSIDKKSKEWLIFNSQLNTIMIEKFLIGYYNTPIHPFKIIKEKESKEIFKKSIPNIEWNSKEMEKIKQFLTLQQFGLNGFIGYEYSALLISSKILKSMISKLTSLEYNLTINRMNVYII